jgi:hypothetical protein
MSDDDTAARDEQAREKRPLSDQERAELYREQLKQLHVVDLVRDMMVTLVTVGYEKLGLTEQTRELRDLGDARVAIESLRRLIEVVEGEGDPEVASLRSTLAQMQLNFARVASAEPRRDAATPRAPAAAEQAQPAAPPEERSAADSRAPREGEDRPAKQADGGPRRGAATPKPTAKKPTAKKPVAKKPAAKKPPVKKPAAKKPIAKKATARRPAAKKPPAE